MSDKCTLMVNGVEIHAQSGDTILNAAMRGNVNIPQDCCTGQCNTCRVKVLSGEVDDKGTAVQDMVLACTATIYGNASIEYEEVPLATNREGVITSIRNISPEIMEVLISLDQPLECLAGQYVKLTFNGFPSRDYSPTAFEDGEYDDNTLVFHIKRYEGGLISTAINTSIEVGHSVKVNGPYGHAFYREGAGRLVLIASGTGFSPIWAVAREAVLLHPHREMVVVVGARHAANLYMSKSLVWLAERGVKNITVCASGFGYGGLVQKGRPTDFMPKLSKSDVVYTAGVPEMVAAVEQIAHGVGAVCYADPFTMDHTGLSIFNRVTQALKLNKGSNPLSPRVEGAKPVFTTTERGEQSLRAQPTSKYVRARQTNNERTRAQR